MKCPNAPVQRIYWTRVKQGEQICYLIWCYKKCLFFKLKCRESNWVLATNSCFQILISLQPGVVDLLYFKL